MPTNDLPQAWQCSDCGETVDSGMFDCWNCGTSCDGVRDPAFACADDERAWNDNRLAPIELPSKPTAVRDGAPRNVRATLAKLAICTLFVVSVGAAIVWWIQLPRTAGDFYNRGITRLHDRDYKGAIDDFSESLHRSEQASKGEARLPKALLPFVRANRAVAYLNNGDHDRAIDDLNASLESTAFDDFFLVNGTLVGRPVSSMQSVDPTCSSEGYFFFVSNPEKHVVFWRLMRAEANLRAGRPESAVADANEILHYFPDHKTAKSVLSAAKEGRDFNWNVQVTREF
jgi:tetratricopeptide (TPR) repeat protein